MFDTPLLELLHSAAQVHRMYNDPQMVPFYFSALADELCKLGVDPYEQTCKAAKNEFLIFLDVYMVINVVCSKVVAGVALPNLESL